jgi:hypothetical protein
MKLRIFHGPTNISGFAKKPSSWQREQGAVADTVIKIGNIYDPPGDINLDLKNYNFLRRYIIVFLFFLFCLFRYNFFNFYFGLSLLPLNLDLPILRLFGKKIIMTYCGSDIRLIEIEKKRNPYWHLLRHGLNDPKFDRMKKIKMHWHRLWVHKAIAPKNSYAPAASVFPAEMIIKDIVPHHLMDTNIFVPKKYDSKEVPVFLHAPSKTDIKGTVFIEQVISELEREGYNFKYRRLHGVPYHEVHEFIKNEADIILDQLLLGTFGQLAVEGMYYGKPVVAYIFESVKEELFPDCPVVNANIDNLKEKLIWLIENPDERIRLGREGRSFVEKHFDQEKINKYIWDLYLSI